MKFISKTMFGIALFLCAASAFGQTTASFSGKVADKEGSPLPGTVINATHEPTGTRYSAVSRADGRFSLFNVRVGGPYSLTANMSGFQPQTEKNIFVKLGENRKLTFVLHVSTVEESLVVVASSNPLINSSRTGATANVTTEQLEKLPTINRSLTDFARTSSYFSEDRTNGSLSVGGRNNRYNQIQIDGAQNTDLFGLAASNSPGGQTESQPISLDAVQELELIVSPYHVKYNGFTGGGINAVTRNGTNTYEGSAYYFYRDKDYVGDGPTDTEFGEFENTQLGVRIGGPIIKDKAFFFVNAEIDRQDQPSPWLIEGNDEQDALDFGHKDEADEFLQILRDVYDYDPGGYGAFVRQTDADHFFVRFDFNLNENHQFIARHNFVDSVNDSRERSQRDFEFPDGFYLIEDTTNSTVFQLNSTMGGYVNEARLTYTTIKDRRGPRGDPFPYVEVGISNRRDLRAGTERFSTANALDQDLLEFNNELTFFKGDHTVTLGMNLQSISFKNLFVQDHFGNYDFSSLENFRNGVASRYQHSYSLTDNPLDAAEVDVNQYGIYAGDEWQLADNFNLVLGLRGDVPYFGDDPTRNPVTEEVFGVSTNVSPDGNILWSPRLGFNWDINNDGKSQLRGGLGIFSGRPVYVWLSNNYSNTGVEYARIDARGEIDFNTDPNSQPRNFPVTSATNTEYNMVDPDFKYPQVLRGSLGYDQELPWWGMLGTAEVIYTDNMEEVLYRNLNLQPVGTNDYDGRTIMGAVDATEGNAYYLTNTSAGYSWNATFKLERPITDGLYWSASYTRGKSRALLDATSSRAVSNYRNLETTGNSNENSMGYSDFDIKHRYVASVSYTKDFIKNNPTTVSLYYNLRSGRPYSSTYFDDANGDGNRFNDLIYVPIDEEDANLVEGSSWEELDAWITNDSALNAARGTIVGRNVSREPWTSLIDLRLSQDVMVNKYKIQLSLDIQNFGNLLDKDSGNLPATNFNNLSVLGIANDLDEDDRPQFEFFNSRDEEGSFNRSGTNDTYSRWYAKFGFRLTF